MSKQAAEEQIRQRAAELLEAGEVAAFIGWEAARMPNRTTPLICFSSAHTERLVFTDYCVNNLATIVLELKARGRVGLVVRGCDARAINRLLHDNQISREQVYLIGVGCPGMKDHKTDRLLCMCLLCEHKHACVYDDFIGEPVVEGESEARLAGVKFVEAMERQARQDFFNEAYSKCIRCYACRNVCPCCTCRSCFADCAEGWLGKECNLNNNRYYGVIRAFHIADRCIDCGECERVCPANLPLMALNRKMAADMAGLFGACDGGASPENPDVLVTYDLADLEEFM